MKHIGIYSTDSLFLEVPLPVAPVGPFFLKKCHYGCQSWPVSQTAHPLCLNETSWCFSSIICGPQMMKPCDILLKCLKKPWMHCNWILAGMAAVAWVTQWKFFFLLFCFFFFLQILLDKAGGPLFNLFISHFWILAHLAFQSCRSSEIILCDVSSSLRVHRSSAASGVRYPFTTSLGREGNDSHTNDQQQNHTVYWKQLHALAAANQKKAEHEWLTQWTTRKESLTGKKHLWQDRDSATH